MRDREAAALRESDAVLDGLASITGMERPGEAVERLLHSIRASLLCDLVLLVSGQERAARITHATSATLVGMALPDLLLAERRPLRVADTSALGWWSLVAAPLRGLRALLSVPIDLPDRGNAVILCLAESPGYFGPESKSLLSRLAGFATQALGSLAMSDRNRLLAGVIDGSSASVVIADARKPDAPLVYVNDAFTQLSGYAAGEVVGRNCRFLADEDAGSAERSRLRQTVAARGSGTFVLRNRRRDGGVFWNRLTLYPISGDDGAADYLVATQVDITAERAAEEARREAEYRLSAALSATSEGFLLVDPAGLVVFANSRVREFFGRSDTLWQQGAAFEESWSQRLQHLGVPADKAKEKARDRLAMLTDGGDRREERLPDGRVLLINDRPLGNGGAVSIATDITSLKATERMLEQRAAAIDATHDGIAITDIHGLFVYMNAAHARMFGFGDESEYLGRSWKMLYAPQDADVIERVGMAQLAKSGTWQTEITGRMQDGSPVEQEVSLTFLEGSGLVCVTRDISIRNRNERERAKLREQLNHAQRQEAVAQLAAGIAHDFNNLLSVITTSAAILDADLSGHPGARDHLGRILSAGNQAADLVRKLLESGRQPEAARPIDLAAALSDAAELLRTGMPASVTISVDAATELPPITADPGDVLQVVLNLGINARDALGQGVGTIRLSVGPADPVCGRGHLMVGRLEPGRRYLQLTVADNGPGIPDDLRRAIVKPYFTTKGADGTGLGLAVVSTIVRKIGGALMLQTAPGEGAVFSVFWPLDPAEPSRIELLDAPSTDRHPEALQHATILICDDVPEVGESIAAILTAAGAEAAVCEDPRDALHAITEDPGAWSLLITDYDMPHMTGEGLAGAVRKVCPGLPILLCTALDQHGDRGQLFEAVIHKPVQPALLVSTIVALLPATETAER
ncbi:MAG: PAS domain S-box protein [Pseudomonadota bacterium]